jgi:hypothetical protein
VIKDIVVTLNVGERACPAGDYAVSIAATQSRLFTRKMSI